MDNALAATADNEGARKIEIRLVRFQLLSHVGILLRCEKEGSVIGITV